MIAAPAPETGVLPEVPSRRWAIPAVVIPGLLYLGVRVVGMALYLGMAARNHGINLRPWDAVWYLKIAEKGYFDAAQGMNDLHGKASPYGAMAFFPGYPGLVRVAAVVFGHQYLAAGIFVSTVAGIVGAYGIARLARLLWGDRRAELIAVVLVAAAPMSVVYSLAYPEALLVALSAWILVGILERRWWMVCLLVVAAGLTSPMAVPLIPVVIAAAIVDVKRERAMWGAAAGAALSMTGALGYLLWVHVETNGFGYFNISEAGWGNHFDFGRTTAVWIFDTVTKARDAYPLVVVAVVLAAIGGIVAAWRRMPWQVWVYVVLTVALALGHSGLIVDRPRLLLSAFPLLVLAAVRLSRARPRLAIGVTVAFALAGLWFGAYSLAVWPYSI